MSFLAASRYPMELVVVNDGSTDESSSILEEFISDPRVMVINQINKGLSHALNRGFERIRGSFLTWTSADNYYLPGALDRLADFLMNNQQVGLVYANVGLIDQEGRTFCESSYRKSDQDPQNPANLLLPIESDTLSEINDNFINACFLFRRDARDLAGLHDPQCDGFEDYDYWLRISLAKPIVHLDSDDIIYHYRLHRDSMTSRLDTDNLSRGQSPLVQHTRSARSLLGSGLEFCVIPSAPGSEQLARFVAATLEAEKHLVSLEDHQPSGDEELDALCQISLRGRSAQFLPFYPGDAEALEDGRKKVVCVCRPACLSADISYLHSSLIQCHFAGWNEPLIVWAANDQKVRRTVSDQVSLTPGKLILPPLEVPSALKRARDSFHFAVTPEPDSQGTVLILSPDAPDSAEPQQTSENYQWSMDRILGIVSELQDFTFVLYCENQAQRRSADQINLALDDHRNLRIIDLTESSETPGKNHPGDALRPLSLMYVLSSVDLLLSVKSPSWDISSCLELRAEAALAASAGMNIIALGGDPLPLSSGCIGNYLCRTDSAATTFAISALAAEIAQIPHLGLAFASSAKEPSGNLPGLADYLTSAIQRPNRRALDQWLETLTASHLGSQISSLFFSRLVEE